MRRAKKIKWRGDNWSFDSYKLYTAWLWGALSEKRKDGSILPPVHPVLAEEFRNGAWCYGAGYIILADNFDPPSFVAQLKRNHQYRLYALLAQAGAA